MSLKKEDLVAIGLDEKMAATVAQLSKNDEDDVVGAATKAVKDRFDEDLEKLSGKKKGDNIQTHVFLKEVVTDFKTQAEKAAGSEDLQKEIDKLKGEKSDLEKQIKEGNADAALTKKVKDLEDQLTVKNDEIQQLKTDNDKLIGEKDTEIESLRGQSHNLTLRTSFDKYIRDNKVKFRADIPQSLLDETLERRQNDLISSIKTMQVEGKTIVVDDEKKPIRNKDKNNDPYTPGDYFGSKIADLVDPGKQIKGGGTGGDGGTGGGTSTRLDLSAAKTQKEALPIINNYLKTVEGLAVTDGKFYERQADIAKENGVYDMEVM